MEEHLPTLVTPLYYFLLHHNLLPGFLRDPQLGELHFELIAFAWLVILVVTLLSVIAARRLQKIPNRFQSAMESVVEKLAQLLDALMGPGGRTYLPVLGTVFIFIFCMNLMGLVPGMMSPTANWNCTIALALTVIVFVHIVAIRKNGFLGYFKHLFGSPQGLVMWLMAPLMFPLHILGELVKPFSLSLRLYGNIHGEDVVFVTFAGLVKSAGIMAPLPFLLLFFMFVLSVLFSFLQAFIFTALSCVYIMLLTTHEETEH